MKWHTEPLTISDLVLFQVDLDNGDNDTHVGYKGDEDDTMWDAHDCDIGWQAEDVSRWVPLKEILENLRCIELTNPNGQPVTLNRIQIIETQSAKDGSCDIKTTQLPVPIWLNVKESVETVRELIRRADE